MQVCQLASTCEKHHFLPVLTLRANVGRGRHAFFDSTQCSLVFDQLTAGATLSASLAVAVPLAAGSDRCTCIPTCPS